MRKGIRKLLKWLLVVFTLAMAAALILSYCATAIGPEENPWLPFFGLAYPLVFSLNALLLVLWIFQKKWIFLVPLVSIALGLSYHQHFFQFVGKDKPETKKENSVGMLSYNVRLFNLYHELDHITTRDSVLDMFQAEDADIICLQEFYYTAKEDGFVTREKLLEQLDNSYFHERYTHELSGERYFGVATFSRYPIVQRGEIPFESDDNNYCIYSDIDINGDTVRVFNTHLSSIRFGEEDYRFISNLTDDRQQLEEGGKRIAQRLVSAYKKRQAQVNKIMGNIIRSPYPVIFCGDFNDTPISYTYSCVDEILQDAFVQSGSGLGRTYIGPFPSFRIDYIWHDDSFESYGFKTIPLELSDHLPIRVDLVY